MVDPIPAFRADSALFKELGSLAFLKMFPRRTKLPIPPKAPPNTAPLVNPSSIASPPLQTLDIEEATPRPIASSVICLPIPPTLNVSTALIFALSITVAVLPFAKRDPIIGIDHSPNFCIPPAVLRAPFWSLLKPAFPAKAATPLVGTANMPGANPAKWPIDLAIDSYVVLGLSATGIVVKPSTKPPVN